jgi:putative hemolysin
VIAIPLVLALSGLLLSAFFSGSETGFYRAHRLRFVVDSMGGDRLAQLLLRLFNRPAWFVSTALVGNNIANYLASLAIVLLASQVGVWAEYTFPLILAPFLFVYGELLPKHLFYLAPNYLLRLVAPLVVFFALLFAPLSIALSGISRLMERWIGQSPVKVKTTLARRELSQFLLEGQEAGVLLPIQREIAESFLLLASKPIREFCLPLSQIEFVRDEYTIEEVLKIAERHQLAEIPVLKSKSHQLIGYVRTSDLLFEKIKSRPLRRIRKLREILSTELYGESLIQMHSANDTMLKVVGLQGQLVGLVTLNRLTQRILEGTIDPL